MANGDSVYQSAETWHVKLQDAISATDNGVWIDTRGYPDGSIGVTIATTATIQIRGSDAPTIPANNTDGNQLGSDVTASTTLDLTDAPRWLKCKISAWTSGAVTVTATLRRRASS